MIITSIDQIKPDKVYYTCTEENVLESISSNLEPESIKRAIASGMIYDSHIEIVLEIAIRTGIIREKSQQAVVSFQAIADYEEEKFCYGNRDQTSKNNLLS